MKKIAKLLTLALGVFMLASCEDVPSPYGTVTPPEEPTKVLPTGDGTKDNPYNVAGAIEKCQEIGPEVSKDKYYIKGLVVATASASADYGNATFYIHDEGSNTKFYCYQVAGPDGKKLSEGYTFKVDDEVVIYGPMYNYNGNTPETASKGAAWVVLHNGEAPGGGDTPSGDAKGTGTLEDPFNSVAAATEALKLASGTVSDKPYYIKGKVSEIAKDKNGNVQNYDYGTYGNASFYVSDDGTTTSQFYCYRVLYLGNQKWTEGAGAPLKVGDDVIVCAKLTNYNGTPETQQNEGYLYSLNGKTEGGSSGGDTPSGDAKGTGTLEDPFNAVAATTEALKLASGSTSDKPYYIKGKVSEIAKDKNGNVQNYDYGTYGNASFYVSDDGTTTSQFYCYRVLYLGNQKWTEGAGAPLKVGDDVIVCAKLTNYNGTPETQQNEGYLYSLNGKTEGGSTGGGDTGGGTGGGDTGIGTYANPYTVTSGIAAEGDGAATKVQNVYIKGYIVGWVEGQVLAEGAHFNATATVKSNILIAASASETNVANCMPVQLPSGAVRNGINLQDNASFYGKEVLLYGNLEKYFGAAGVKSVTYAEIDGSSFGTKP